LIIKQRKFQGKDLNFDCVILPDLKRGIEEENGTVGTKS